MNFFVNISVDAGFCNFVGVNKFKSRARPRIGRKRNRNGGPKRITDRGLGEAMYVICIKQLAAYLKTLVMVINTQKATFERRIDYARYDACPELYDLLIRHKFRAGSGSVVVRMIDSRGKGRKLQTGQAKLFPHNRIRVGTPTREKRDEKSKSE